jgi:hypothetical protein
MLTTRLLLAVSLLMTGCGTDVAHHHARAVAPCSWSYFGDPRAVAHGDRVLTGCIGTEGTALVEDVDLRTGSRRRLSLFKGLEVDDHNNPSLVFFHGRLFAFSSPHSGYVYPRNRRSRVRYRISERPWAQGGGFGPARTIPLGRGCGLGYTYPNPVVSGGRLYLFLRGPCWVPYFTSTSDGVHWTAARTLLRGAGRRIRPYAKYAAAPDGSILMAFSDSHPASYKSSLYYLRFKDGRFTRADGSLAGALADLPLAIDRLDRVHAYSPAAGRAWPMDIAWDPAGAPVVAYSALVRGADVLRYGRWSGGRWETHAIARAGRDVFAYHNGGVTLDHRDPSWVVLSRTVGAHNEIEARHTPDRGASWTRTAVTRHSAEDNVRPVIPRGLAPGRRVVLYVSGRSPDYRSYDTSVMMSTDARSAPVDSGGAQGAS